MTNPIIVIHDADKKEVIEREMTKSELTQYQKDIESMQKRLQDIEDAKAAKSALLEKLQITEDEAKLLLG